MTSNAPLYPLICLRSEAVTAYILLHYSELEFFTNTGNPKCLRRQFHTQLLPVHIPSLPSVPFMLPEHVTCARKPPEPPNTPCFLPSVTGQELLPLPGIPLSSTGSQVQTLLPPFIPCTTPRSAAQIEHLCPLPCCSLSQLSFSP